MNVKKLALIGVIALVIIGFVVAAGCTSTPTDNSVQTPTPVETTAPVQTPTPVETTVPVVAENVSEKINETKEVVEAILGNWELNYSKIADKVSEALPNLVENISAEKNLSTDDAAAHIKVNAVINDDGTGKLVFSAEGVEAGNNQFTWKKVDTEAYSMNIFGNETEFKFDEEKGILTDAAGIFDMIKELA